MSSNSLLVSAAAVAMLATAPLAAAASTTSAQSSLAPAARSAVTTSIAAASLTPDQALEQATFTAINAARARAGLPAFRWSAALQRSAHLHNARMAATDILSHQLPGEPPLGQRISAQGVHWTYAAENIGWTTAMNRTGALAIVHAMLAERPPYDGHRLNILSRHTTMLGIDVILDSKHHKLWMTQDFAN